MKHRATLFLTGASMLLLHGCAVFRLRREIPDPPPRSPQTPPLVHVGGSAVYLGAIILVLLILARVACFFPLTSFLLPFAPLFGEGVALCATSIICGTALVWVGAHDWLLYSLGGVAAAVYVVRHRSVLLSMVTFWR